MDLPLNAYLEPKPFDDFPVEDAVPRPTRNDFIFHNPCLPLKKRFTPIPRYAAGQKATWLGLTFRIGPSVTGSRRMVSVT